MLYRSSDAFGNPIDTPSAPGLVEKKYKNPVLSTVRTRSDVEPKERGTSVVTREEYDALVVRIAELEALIRDTVTRYVTNSVTSNAETVTVTVTGNDVTKTRGNGNALSAAEKMRRYRERKKRESL